MARILFVQPSLQPPGGGNSVGVWMLQAIVAQHDVTVFTWNPVEFDAINRFYGTSLKREDVELREVPRLLRAAIDWIPLPLALLRTALLGYSASRLGRPFDLAMSANNEAEFGPPNIQYIHYPAFTRPRPLIDIRWYHRPAFILDLYYAVADRLLPLSLERMLAGRTFVNSNWTGRAFVRRHGGSVETLYPPVPSFPDVPWAERQNAFVCIGRLAPEKAHERVLDIVARVRCTYPDVRLHLIGSVERRSWYSARMLRRLRSLDWVTLHLDVSRDELVRLVTTSRYGIHGMTDEHFGMAPAEMVAGGCLTWVHNSGGQVEIVNGDPRFTYDDADDAVAKILRMMSDGDAHETVRAALRRRTREFSVERFQERVGVVVAGMLADMSSTRP